MTPNIIVVDLDGTLSDDAWRASWIETKQWDEYHSRLVDDKPHVDVLTFLQMAARMDFSIIAVTARPAKWYQQTFQWLQRHQVMIDTILMRGDDDYRPSEEVKADLLREWSENAYGESFPLSEVVLCVLEDLDRCVEAWRAMGLNCWQVRMSS